MITPCLLEVFPVFLLLFVYFCFPTLPICKVNFLEPEDGLPGSSPCFPLPVFNNEPELRGPSQCHSSHQNWDSQNFLKTSESPATLVQARSGQQSVGGNTLCCPACLVHQQLPAGLLEALESASSDRSKDLTHRECCNGTDKLLLLPRISQASAGARLEAAPGRSGDPYRCACHIKPLFLRASLILHSLLWVLGFDIFSTFSPFLDTLLRFLKPDFTHVHCRIIYNHQDIETT